MKQFSSILEHPAVRFGVSPLALCAFGVLVGASVAGSVSWMSALLLYLISVSWQLLNEYFFLKYDSGKAENVNPLILYIGEALLAVSIVIFSLSHHWALTIILIMYAVFLHLQYYPHNWTYTPYQFTLLVFFQSIVLNSVAYFSQAKGITLSFMMTLLPLVILQLALQNESFKLKSGLIRLRTPHWLVKSPLMSLAVAIVALLLALVLSLPSKSWFLMQLFMLIATVLSFGPLMIQPKKISQAYKKLNYLSAVYCVFVLLYALSYIF